MPRGRKPTGNLRLKTSVRLRPDIHGWVMSRANAAEFIRDLIEDAYIHSDESEEDVANHSMRRQTGKALSKMISNSLGYVLLAIDPDDGGVKAMFSTTGIADQEDPRQKFMVAVRDNAVVKVKQVNAAYLQYIETKKQSVRAQETIAKRDEELAGMADDEPIDPSLVATDEELAAEDNMEELDDLEG